MKKTLLFVSILMTFLMMLAPSISAIEFNEVFESYKSKISEEHDSIIQKIKAEFTKDGKIDNILDNIGTLGNTEKTIKYLYLLISQLMITLLVGKPSLYRMLQNFLLVTMIIDSIQGDDVLECSLMNAAVVYNTIALGIAAIYHKNPRVGLIIGLIYYLFIGPQVILFFYNSQT